MEPAADWLEDLGAIDDAAYARLVARHYGARGYGPGRVREELRRRRAESVRNVKSTNGRISLGRPQEMWKEGDEWLD